jgi:hypothetical protein
VGQVRKPPFYFYMEKSFVPGTVLCIHFEDIDRLMNVIQNEEMKFLPVSPFKKLNQCTEVHTKRL